MLAGAAKQDIKEREVTILGDRNTPYKVLRKVMATAPMPSTARCRSPSSSARPAARPAATERTASLIQ